MAEDYLFLYCTIHDDGFFIRESNNTNFNYCYCPCDFHDLLHIGSITYDGINLIEHSIIFNLDRRFNGGFDFNYYIYNWFFN